MRQQKFVEIYQYFFRKVSGFSKTDINLSDTEKKMVEKFLTKKPDISEDWLFDYLVFQFSRYQDKITKYGKGVVPINWVIGVKAEAAWKARTEQQLYYAQKFKAEYGIIKNVDWKNSFSEHFKNRERKRFHNTELGFLNCKDFELKREINKYCITCKFKKYCE